MAFLDKLYDLDGKVAVVIGGTGELCGELAKGLASCGTRIVIAGRNADKAAEKIAAIEAVGGMADFVETNVADPQSIHKLLDQSIELAGKVDILINGAGVNSATPFFDISSEDFSHIIDINLGSIVRSCQVFGAYFLNRSEPASIINIGSISGLNPLSRVFTYAASKAAVHNLTRNLAREWATENIRVNTLVPGFFPAEQNRKILDESRVASILEKTPMARFGNPEELIAAALLLASAKAGSFITGTEVVVDGGFNAMSI